MSNNKQLENTLLSPGNFLTCPHCNFSKNEPGSETCFICEKSLEFAPSDANSTKLANQKSQNQPLEGKNLALVAIFTLLAGLGVYNLTRPIYLQAEDASLDSSRSNLTAALKKARGVIAYAGEPCSRRFNNLVGKYMAKLNPYVQFRYTDNDRNKDQIQELIEGQIQIAFSEKAFLDSHKQRAKARGVEIEGIPYAFDGIAYVTHRELKIRSLTIAQLEDIFAGKLTNWSELGGKDQKIVPVLMGGESMNPMGIKLGEVANPHTEFFSDRAEAKRYLKKTPGAIFYTSASLAANELDEVNLIELEKEDGTVVSPVVSAGQTNQEDILSGQYPLVRSLYILVHTSAWAKNELKNINPQQEGVKSYVEFILSPRGQKIVKETGFVPKYEVAAEEINFLSSLQSWLQTNSLTNN